MSRRQFLGTSAAAGGVVLSSPLWSPLLADAAFSEPKPIPQTIAPGAPFHIQFVTATTEPSAITDFRGVVGAMDVLGEAWETTPDSDEPVHRFTAVDNRFMQGTYIGVDGNRHHGTFGFV